MTVIWSLLFGYIFFGESITLPMLLGGVLIIIGVYLVQADVIAPESTHENTIV